MDSYFVEFLNFWLRTYNYKIVSVFYRINIYIYIYIYIYLYIIYKIYICVYTYVVTDNVQTRFDRSLD